MNRDELLKLARLYFTDKEFSAVTYESGPYDITNPTIGLKRFAAAIFEMGYAKGKAEGFAAGAEDMRERAITRCQVIKDNPSSKNTAEWGQAITRCQLALRALPITGT